MIYRLVSLVHVWYGEIPRNQSQRSNVATVSSRALRGTRGARGRRVVFEITQRTRDARRARRYSADRSQFIRGRRKRRGTSEWTLLTFGGVQREIWQERTTDERVGGTRVYSVPFGATATFRAARRGAARPTFELAIVASRAATVCTGAR